MTLAVEQRDKFGCVALVTDAKAEAAGFYQKLGFTPLEVSAKADFTASHCHCFSPSTL